MLPKSFFIESKLSLTLLLYSNFDMENLMPYLKRFDSYLLFNQVVINNANIKDERMISILLNSKEIKLIDSKVSLSGLSD
jgi:hypothetical protein